MSGWYERFLGVFLAVEVAGGLAANPATGGYWTLTASGAVTAIRAPWHGAPRGRAVTAIAGQ